MAAKLRTETARESTLQPENRSYGSYTTYRTYGIKNAMPDDPPDSLLPPHGNYRELLSYQKAEVVYDLTYQFCARHLRRGRDSPW